MSEHVTLLGVLDRVIYANAEKGFLIAHFLPDTAKTSIIIKGTVFNVNEGNRLQVKGKWVVHKQYGRQLDVIEFTPSEPVSRSGIERYLSSEIPGIGKKTAERIVKKFGEDTFRIIDEEPEKLMDIPRFSKTQLDAILDTREDQRHLREIMSFLHGLGISSSYAHKIFQAYGISSLPVIQENPYQLTQLDGIGFQTADMIARQVGFDQNSPQRAMASVLYLLDQLSSEGHTCYPKELLAQMVVQKMEIQDDVVQQAIQQLQTDRVLHTQDVLNPEGGHDIPMVAKKRFFKAESLIAENLMRLLQLPSYQSFGDPSALIEDYEEQLGIQLDPKQREAVEAALEHKVLIITGGPGTGKTTIIRFILALFKKRLSKAALATPTGKASKRLSEATDHAASTIHRLLEFGNTGFQRNRDNPIESELIIIDETSMMDVMLTRALLDAIDSHAHLILVGDVDQLPSVGPGSVLGDLIASDQVPVVRLETIFRQSHHSLITVNAHHVRKGQMPTVEAPSKDQLCDFYFMEEADPERIVAKMLKVITERIPERFQFDPKNDVQVLTPMHRGATGSVSLNQRLQEALNPGKVGLEYKGWNFKVGDKVIQHKNSYDKQVFNGDMGEILECRPKSKELLIAFDQLEVTYSESDLDELTLAYAITVHKSQGSEYPAIVLPFTTHHYLMLQRNLLYTALTRGKQLVILIGTEKAVRLAVENEKKVFRHTLLQSELEALK